MPIVAHIEQTGLLVPLQTLADALAARAALARSLPDDLTHCDIMPFARLEAQVNDQLEASAAYLAAESSQPIFA
jgi:hypothetical protein